MIDIQKNIIHLHCIVYGDTSANFCATLYTKDHKKISTGKSDKYGLIHLSFPSTGKYYVTVTSKKCELSPRSITTWINLKKPQDYSIDFVFNYKNPRIAYITFYLTDAKYSGLPIEKGEFYLWQLQ